MSGVSLHDIMTSITCENDNIVYLKGKRGKFQKGIHYFNELSNLKLKRYKDYYRLPRLTSNDLYNGFLNSVHLKKLKYELHQEKDFVVAFRIFIECYPELFEQYCRYDYNITKKMALDWCKKYRIKYIDDTDQYWKPKD